jgi:CRP/FNR family transcriptional regulator, cyclic AMP receptor protein
MICEKAIYHPHNTVIKMINRELLILQHAGIVRRLNKRKIIHISDSSIKYFYFLQKGLIKISNVNDDGRELIKYFVKPGDTFGELNLLDNEEDRNEIGAAIEDCEVCVIPVDSVKQKMSSDPAFRKNINHSIGRRIKKMEDRFYSLSLKGARERILDFLKEFVVEFGYPVNSGYAAKIFITHADIARITSTSRQSVTMSLTHFKKSGLINYDSKTLTVFNCQPQISLHIKPAI